ncbi:MAG: Rrf2 family transcriptional regulator [Rhizobiales bacterium]|nr:Rrf2 family transcriptional regulator [Hyphomicrobiales bacterium]NRB12948.1 Rrf2 family transcriptional regulator [Hyphomicrobiales bacterium]
MKLSTRGQYAVMAMVDLAKHNNQNEPTSLSAIAVRQNISLPYLEQLFSRLRKSHLVTSVRGPQGGYFLALEATAIKIADIIDAADEDIKIAICAGSNGVICGKESVCHTTSLWKALADHIDAFFENITLEDLVVGKPLANLFKLEPDMGLTSSAVNSY